MSFSHLAFLPAANEAFFVGAAKPAFLIGPEKEPLLSGNGPSVRDIVLFIFCSGIMGVSFSFLPFGRILLKKFLAPVVFFIRSVFFSY